jgi:protein-tyrosine phosphatase
MIDLHCHLLPEIDDGAKSLEMSLAMARIAQADGITTTACTPHIYPGLYENRRDDIRIRVRRLSGQLCDAGIELSLTEGADIQIVPELVYGLTSGQMATLNNTRYFLFEPPHTVVPRQFETLIFQSLAAGYVPVITHPERLTWLDDEHYDWFVDAAFEGAWIQLTGGAIAGHFGKRARYWSERFLDDGLVHIIASDGHDDRRRIPILSEGRRAAEQWVSSAEAEQMVLHRPRAILENQPPSTIQPPPALASTASTAPKQPGIRGILQRLWQ